MKKIRDYEVTVGKLPRGEKNLDGVQQIQVQRSEAAKVEGQTMAQ